MINTRSSAAWLRRSRQRSFINSNRSRAAPHTSLDSLLSSFLPGDGFGDNHLVRAPGSARLVFQNINTIPDESDDPKQAQLNHWIRNERVDFLLLAELNKFWPAVTPTKRWRERASTMARKGEGFHSAVAYNTHQPRAAHSTTQFGGCATSAFNEVSHRVRSSGEDSLGRWAWIRLQGQRRGEGQRDLVVVSAYRPNPPTAGQQTVWFQHKAHFSRTNREADPRDAFVKDISTAINKWRDSGCSIILGIDANDDLSSYSPKSFRFRMSEVGLLEVIQSKHPGAHQATYQRNRRGYPIDGIFATPDVPILAAGYYPFDEHVASDHRGLWIDFDLNLLLGGHKPKKSTHAPRRLVMHNKRVVQRYVQLAEEGYMRYNIPGRLSSLGFDVARQQGDITHSQAARFDRIHADAYTVRRLAEQNCRKLSMGGTEWSPAGQSLRDRITLWRLLLKGHRQCRVSSRKVRRLLSKTNEPLAWKLTTAELESHLTQDLGKYREAKRGLTATWRRAHVTTRTQSIAKVRHKTASQRERYHRLRSMKQREETRRRRRARSSGLSGGLRAIQVEQEDSSGNRRLQTITDPTLVEEGCMQENRARYQQTQTPHPTPPMSEPLYTMFTGPDADNNQQLLLEGKLPIPGGLAYPTQAFLRHCRLHDSYRSRPFPLTVEEHVDFWSRTPENKGSEPHGLHNGHFKAGALSELLASCDTAFRDLPLRSGHVPELWKNLMNFAIEKKPGDFRPEGMRTIQLFNSEAQANYKKAGRAAMRNAEEDDIIPKGQCGSRKQHQSIDLALSKRLIWDSLILERRASGWISNDAKSCFDRIVHWVAKTALRRFGIPATVTNLMFDILAKAKHRVRTGFGDSERTFGPTGETPFQGCGQGNGAGPCIWVAISAILIDAMEAEGFGYTSRTALTNEEFFASCFCFVDDTDVMESKDDLEVTGEDLLPSVQSALDLWSGGISATGGAINPAKSFWWLIDFKWRPASGTWVFRRKAAMPGDLTLQGPTGLWATLRRLQPDEAERTLGVMMAPLETGAAQHLALREKAKDWAAKFRPRHLLRYDVIPLIKSTAMKTLEYVMPLSTLGRAEWVSIMSPILQASLHKAGVCRSFPRVVVFAPLKYQGLGIPHPFALQVFHHLSVLMRHSANRTKTGQYLEANLQSHQLETGTSFPLLQQQPTNTGILASATWIKRVWIELDALGIRVEISSPSLSLHCAKDRLLMDIFIDALVDQEDLLWLNWCRQYLHVTTLSELATADGRSLTAAALAGEPSGHFVELYNWPRTRRPGSSHWDLWRSVLSQAVLRPYSRRRLLLQPLGPWTDSLDRWTWLLSRTLSILFHRTDSTLAIYRPINSRSHKTFRRDLHQTWTGPLPKDVQRASVNTHPRTAYVTVTSTASAEPPDLTSLPASILHIWKELAAEMDDDWGWVPEYIYIEGDEQVLLEAMEHGKLRVVSDGSYKQQVGTAAVQLRTRRGGHIIWIKCRAPGRREAQSAYRSELIGLLAGILVSSWLRLRLQSKTKPRVRVACDGIAALRQAFSTWPLSPTSPHFDLLSSIREALRVSNISWAEQHVGGHADRRKTWQQMSWWERRNSEVDAIAQGYADELIATDDTIATNPRFFSEPCAVYIDNEKVSCLALESVDEAVVLPELMEYWERKGRLTPETFRLVDWPIVHRAMKSLKPAEQRYITKHTVGMCGVSKFRKRWGLDSENRCPLCGLEEDHLHVPRCPSDRAKTQWQTLLQGLQEWFQTTSTATPLAQFLGALLRTVRVPNNQPPPQTPWYRLHGMSSSALTQVCEAQLRLGPQCLLEGLLVHGWADLQQQFYRSRGSRRSGNLWAANLSRQLILIGKGMWKHRNDVFHSDDNIVHQQRATALDRRIHEEFDMGLRDLPQNLRPAIRRSRLMDVLRLQLADKEEWVLVISEARRKIRRSLAGRRRLMWELTHPSPTPAVP